MLKDLICDIKNDWSSVLQIEMQKSYFSKLENFLENNDQIILPTQNNIFAAFKKCAFSDIKVVIIGQDPYHGIGQANGLSFSVNEGVKIPPSLKNIFKELESDLKINPPIHGNLNQWSEQGVFLLNAALTVDKKKASSHLKAGWQTFTDSIIKTVNAKCENIVFILWGNFAQKKKELINEKKHFIIESAHPSPLSAYQGFWGSKPFSKTNNFLKQKKIMEIEWEIK
jgi:uracil-DNA glycosylase